MERIELRSPTFIGVSWPEKKGVVDGLASLPQTLKM